MTRKYLLLAGILLIVAASVWAATSTGENTGTKEWWPGEGPGGGQRNVATGQVVSVDSSHITIQNKQGTLDFIVTAQTKVRVEGEPGEITDIKPGDPAIVRFAVNTDGTRTALGIMEPEPRTAGQITAVSGNSITLQGREKTWKVTLATDTKIVSHRDYIGTPADLRVGYWAAARGEIKGDSVQAKVVHFRPEAIRGVVQQVSGNTITVQTLRQKTVAVTVTDATAILVRPRTAANHKGTIADIKPDMPINIGGHITGEGTMQALWADLLVGGRPGPGMQPPQNRSGVIRPRAGAPRRQ